MKKVSSRPINVRNPETGKFDPMMAIRGESAYDIAVRLGKFTGTEEEWANFIEMERAAAVQSIEDKGQQTRASIPDDYTALNARVTVGIHGVDSIRDVHDTMQIRSYTWAAKAYSADARSLTSSIVEAQRDIFLKLDGDYEMFVYFFEDAADESSCIVYFGNVKEARIIEGQKFAIKIMRLDRADITVDEKFNLQEDLAKRDEYAAKYANAYIKENSNNLFSFEDGHFNGVDAAGKPFMIYVKNNRFYVTSLPLSTDARIKISNGYGVHWGNFPQSGLATVDTTAEAWVQESVAELEAGKPYCIYVDRYAQLENNSDVTFSIRNASFESVLKSSQNPTTLSDVPSFVMLFVAKSMNLMNYELALVVEASDEPTGAKELDENIRIPHLAGYMKKDEASGGDHTDLLFYRSIASFAHEKIHEDALASYGAVQGMCTDGENIYYTVWRDDDAANTLLCKYNIASDTVTLTAENHSYGHANGIAYIESKGELYVCNMDDAGTVSRVNPATLEFIDSFSLFDTLSPVVEWYKGVGSVAYDATKKKIVFLLRGSAEEDGRTRKGFAIFDDEMRFEKIIKTPFIECDTYSGVSTDENFIYLTVSNPTTTSRGEHLIAYDWHGNLVYDVILNEFSHVEAQARIGDVFYFADNVTYRGATLWRSTIAATGLVSKLDVLSQYNLN